MALRPPRQRLGEHGGGVALGGAGDLLAYQVRDCSARVVGAAAEFFECCVCRISTML